MGERSRWSLEQEIWFYINQWNRSWPYELGVARRLRKLDDADRVAIILRVLRRNSPVGLRLAKFSLRRIPDAEAILRDGLKHADVSSIKWWLRAVKPILGWKGTIAVLHQWVSVSAEDVNKALYHMGKLYEDTVDFHDLVKEARHLMRLITPPSPPAIRRPVRHVVRPRRQPIR